MNTYRWNSRQEMILLGYFLSYPFALNACYNETTQVIKLKARKSREAVEGFCVLVAFLYLKKLTFRALALRLKEHTLENSGF